MTTNTQIAKLSEIALLNPKLTENLEDNSLVSFLSMSAVTAETATTTTGEDREYKEVSRGYTSFFDGDVLLAKITPCFENGKIAQAKISHRIGFGSTEFHVIRPLDGKADARYLLHFLRQDYIRIDGARKMTGSAGQRRVPGHFLASLDVPLPPLEEQKRIAEILDRAESLRAMRRQSIEQLNTLTQAIFLGMFGDPVTNPRGWLQTRFEDTLSIPLRNGSSPSHVGKLMHKVLTLSAITGNKFNETAWKTSTFKFIPPVHQRVDRADFLICRGNGNLHLVGKGYFPTEQMPDVTFPDTIIAARISSEHFEREFLEHIWNSTMVRRQIESSARTTNGTLKVNQTMLENIVILAPPLPLQYEFAQRVRVIEKLKATHQKSLTELDALFASLQHQAFQGEL